MELKMNYDSFIKLKDFFKISNISAEINQYQVVEDTIEGTLDIKGKYVKRDNITDEYFLEQIPFSILMKSQEFEVEDMYCTDFEYVGIEGRGIDVNFDIFVKYSLVEEVPVVIDDEATMVMKDVLQDRTNSTVDKTTDEIVATPLEEHEFEVLKSAETKRVDDLLKSTLNMKDDNLPTEEIVIRGLKDKTSKLKIYYYQSEAELERVCLENQISLDTIFKKNMKFDFNKYHRVIINEK